MTEISDMLLRIAKLYQMKEFDPESSVLLAEWVIDEYKHTDYEIIRLALSKPPIGKEKTWRLTPEVIGEWIEVVRQRTINETERAESIKRQTAPIIFPEKQEEIERIDRLVNETKMKLSAIEEGKRIPVILTKTTEPNPNLSASANYKPLTSNQVAIKNLHIAYIRENYDPITRAKKENWQEENEWLLSKGYFIEDGQLKSIETLTDNPPNQPDFKP